ncbi:MAG: ACP S-malonyltransferase [Eubacterium sp.]|nr:ACP S-malonyltransferase [Eubacterium sp.]
MKLAFLYAGQGSQTAGMGKDLYEANEVFKNTLDRCEKAAEGKMSLKDLMFSSPIEELSMTKYTQPAMGAFAAGITNVLFDAGIVPKVCAGLSLGEYSALYASGVFGEEELINLLIKRGEYMQEAAEGTSTVMSAVLGLERAAIKEAVDEASKMGKVEISNYNSTGQTVIAGEKEAVEKAKELCILKGAKKCMDLNVSGPFHTSFMEPAAKKLEEEFKKIKFGPEKIPVIYNTVAREKNADENTAALLVKQVKSSVYMEDTILLLEKMGIDTVIEIGPGKVLSGFIRRTAKGIKTYAIENNDSLLKVLEVFG